MFRRLADDLGMKGVRVSPHTLRHSFAIDFFDDGGTERALQTILGHSTRKMTDKYGQAALGFIKRQHDRHSPGDRI
jgi:integrase/recombinase XerD